MTGQMIPFRIGDDVRVVPGADTWFAGATGSIKEVYEASGTLMVELDEYATKRIPRGLTLPFAPGELIPIRCQHPNVAEEDMRRYIDRRWYDIMAPECPDCKETLYPEDQDDGSIRIYVGEPKGAGDDYWDRPSHVTNPEYWTE